MPAMTPDLSGFGRALLLVAAVLGVVGALLLLAPKVPWLGRLPGDMIIARERTTFYFPLTTCVLISLVLSLIMWILGRFRS